MWNFLLIIGIGITQQSVQCCIFAAPDVPWRSSSWWQRRRFKPVHIVFTWPIGASPAYLPEVDCPETRISHTVSCEHFGGVGNVAKFAGICTETCAYYRKSKFETTAFSEWGTYAEVLKLLFSGTIALLYIYVHAVRFICRIVLRLGSALKGNWSFTPIWRCW